MLVFFQSLLSPAILFFLVGIINGVLGSDLKVPQSIGKFLSLYLMMAIGLKGGYVIAKTGCFEWHFVGLLLAGICLSFLLPLLAYFFVRRTTALDQITAAALAAHYGSVSVITFITAKTIVQQELLPCAEYLVAVLAAMEAPAIITGLYLAHFGDAKNKENFKSIAHVVSENGTLLLLLASFLIGMIIGEPGFGKLSAFFEAPFQGILCIFLLELGILVSEQLEHIKSFTPGLIAFGIYMPLISATLGLMVSYIMGLDVGTATVFIALCASASYIAVPAAMRLALPEAKAAVYIPMSLAITFPFNIILGIPLYLWLSRYFLG